MKQVFRPLDVSNHTAGFCRQMWQELRAVKAISPGFIVELVLGESTISSRSPGKLCSSGSVQPPFEPRNDCGLCAAAMLVALYSRGDREGCRNEGNFVMNWALAAPAFRTISDFRSGI